MMQLDLRSFIAVSHKQWPCMFKLAAVIIAVMPPQSFSAVVATTTQSTSLTLNGTSTSSPTHVEGSTSKYIPPGGLWIGGGYSLYAEANAISFWDPLSNSRGFFYADVFQRFEKSGGFASDVNGVLDNGPLRSNAGISISGIPQGTKVWFAASGSSPVFYAYLDGVRFGVPYNGSVVVSAGYVDISTVGFSEVYLGLGPSGTRRHASAGMQISLLGPIGSQASPMMVRPTPAVEDNDSSWAPAQESEHVSGIQLTGSGLGIDELFWTSSNPADLFSLSASAARAFTAVAEAREFVYDITGPKVTHLLFDSAFADIAPDLILEFAGLEIAVILGQEIDLTPYNPSGLDHFNLKITGIDDWSILPDDWFLTGYKFAGAGDVLVTTVAVPEIGSFALASLAAVVLPIIRWRGRAGLTG